MIDPIHGVSFQGVAQTAAEQRRTGQQFQTGQRNGFAQAFQQELDRTEGRQVAFSKHALARAEERGIEVTPTLLDRLTDSVERAEAKGATNILALDRSLAFIINVPNQRVITTLSQDEMKENVFTNIDGAVIL